MALPVVTCILWNAAACNGLVLRGAKSGAWEPRAVMQSTKS